MSAAGPDRRTEGSQWGVVLARGASHRMGRPKGECRLADDPRPFLRRILDLYLARDWPTAVVTTDELADRYGSLVTTRPPDLWLTAAGGAGTARTVAVALAGLTGKADRLWLHPVDLPLVRPATLDRLAAKARRRPEAVIVPLHRGRPGHPVGLPTMPFADLAGQDPPGDMRRLIRAGAERGAGFRATLLEVEVEDAGVTEDFDEPPRRSGGQEEDGDE